MSKLEKATYVSLILMSIVSMSLLLERRLRPARRPDALTSLDRLVGKAVEFPTAPWGRSPINVVLHISSTCHFCNESTPLYRELSRLRATAPNIVLYVVTRDPLATMKQYLADRLIETDGIFQTDSPPQGILATPTILLVNSHGVIRRVFLGKLDGNREKDFFAAVKDQKVAMAAPGFRD